MVSICCITFNHERFIRQALDGFLMQETTFPIEIIVHDDASTDRTADIVREYEALYPHVIKAICQTVNQYSRGARPLIKTVFPRVRGRYIALCEGDDYWTAARKLQTQVRFMESHPTYSGCFHNVQVHDERQGSARHLHFPEGAKETLTLSDLVVGNIIPTLSILYRANLYGDFPESLSRLPVGDWPLHVLNAQHGPMHYIDEVFGVYRRHEGGVWSGLQQRDVYERSIVVARAIDKHLEFKYSRVIEHRIAVWHYRIAVEMSRDEIERGVVHHLRQALRHLNDDVPTGDVFRLLFKHSLPRVYSIVYWRWARLKRIMSRHRPTEPAP